MEKQTFPRRKMLGKVSRFGILKKSLECLILIPENQHLFFFFFFRTSIFYELLHTSVTGQGTLDTPVCISERMSEKDNISVVV